MSGDFSKLSRLCRLVEDSLHPYKDLDVYSTTKEKEKEILISLSEILRKVKLCMQESESDNGLVSRFDSENSGGSNPRSDEIQCLSEVVTDLIALLNFRSQFVQHLVGNVLLSVSEFVAASGSNWDAFIHPICASMSLVMTTKLSYCSAPFPVGTDALNCSSCLPSFVLPMKHTLKDANWSAAAGILRLLHAILKSLKRNYHDQLINVYFVSLNSSLSSVPWDSLTGHYVDPSAYAGSIADASLDKLVFLGNFIQLLCSLVELSSALQAADVSVNKHHFLTTIINLVPKLLNWCLGKQEDYSNKLISQYIKHKLLVLMIRFTFHASLDGSILIQWLELAHHHFGELLQQPISSRKSVEDDCLEGSPFLLSVCGSEVNNLCSLHLQRLANFLFMKCSFTLFSIRGGSGDKGPCATQDLYLLHMSDMELDCARKKGLLEIYTWLQGHLPAYMFSDPNMYFRKSIDFASSFIQLYIDEDDLLFKVLLQLLCLPFPVEYQFWKEKLESEDVQKDPLGLVVNLFNPVHLFHLFLSKIHYDHQVLLDYLISKDTGISCAEYLLRCLRIVYDSWRLFVDFSVDEPHVYQSSKKRNVLSDGLSFQKEEYSSFENNEVLSLPEKESSGEYKHGCKQRLTTRRPYEEAKECLLSLKISVDSLHKKQLFPYNPKVLLKRLMRFEELCLKESREFL